MTYERDKNTETSEEDTFDSEKDFIAKVGAGERTFEKGCQAVPAVTT